MPTNRTNLTNLRERVAGVGAVERGERVSVRAVGECERRSNWLTF
jgi:hypothetical protein